MFFSTDEEVLSISLRSPREGLLCLLWSLLVAEIILVWVIPLLKTPVPSRCIFWGSRSKAPESLGLP